MLEEEMFTKPLRAVRRLAGGIGALAVLLGVLVSAGSLEASRCSKSYWSISCSYKETKIASRPGIWRDVRYQLPEGPAPAGGWPVVLIFQGSFFPVEFSRSRLLPFGAYYEADTIKGLLDNGFAVVAPDAGLDLFWESNAPVVYELSADYVFLNNLMNAIAAGHFGNLNAMRKYATGISSGGYNTSRMAVTYNSDSSFKALAVASGSYATCLGPICVVPSNFPKNHPPTYFLHGFLDTTVPWWTMDLYYDALRAKGVAVGRHTDTWKKHEWLPAASGKVVAWFKKYP